MFKISLSDTISHQLREQGYKFKDGVNVSWFEDMKVSIDKLWLNCYATQTEYKKIRERFVEDLEKFVTKIED